MTGRLAKLPLLESGQFLIEGNEQERPRDDILFLFMGILYRLAWALLIIQSRQSRAKVGSKLIVPTPLLYLLTADVWGLVGTKT